MQTGRCWIALCDWIAIIIVSCLCPFAIVMSFYGPLGE